MPAHAIPASEFKVGVSITEVAEFEADFDLTSLLASVGIFPLNISLFCDRVWVDC